MMTFGLLLWFFATKEILFIVCLTEKNGLLLSKGFEARQLGQFSNILLASCVSLNKALNYPKTQVLDHIHVMSTS